MNRRQFVLTVGSVELAIMSLLAGCASTGESPATPTESSPTPTESPATPTESSPTPTESTESRSTLVPSVELTSFDSNGVAEGFTLLLTGTIENTHSESKTVLFVGKINIQDGDNYTGRRLVTVPAEIKLETRVKIRHDESGFFRYDPAAEIVPDPDVTQDELRLPDDAHDLVVVDTDSDSGDAQITVTAVVENMASEPRSAKLGAAIRFTDGSEYSASQQIRIAGGGRKTYEQTFNPDDRTVTYRYTSVVG